MRVLADDARFWALQRAVIALGLALRLAEYLHNDSLWGDEAMLSLSIASRSFHQLLGPLGYGQVASVPFLWAERLMVELFGINEWALRLLPLIAGSGVCVVVALVARRMLRPEEALVAVVLVAFSQTLIRYSEWTALVAGGALPLWAQGPLSSPSPRRSSASPWGLPSWCRRSGKGAWVCSHA